jgi:hypothetical protein
VLKHTEEASFIYPTYWRVVDREDYVATDNTTFGGERLDPFYPPSSINTTQVQAQTSLRSGQPYG